MPPLFRCVVAETDMQNIKEQALATYSETLPLWPLYVDDTVNAIHKIKINEFHERFYKHNTTTHFTKEIEENGKIPFLDCLETRENNTLRKYTVYSRQYTIYSIQYKPTHTTLLDQTS